MTTEIDRTQFYSGGFFLIRCNKPLVGLANDGLLPSKLIGLSDCISLRIDIVWAWHPSYKESILDFGIPKTQLEEFKEWSVKAFPVTFNIGGLFNNEKDAQRFVKKFNLNPMDLYLIEAGLPAYLEADNWRGSTPDINNEGGIEKRISQQVPILSSGEVLGYEVLGFELNNFSTSWLCNYIHRDMFELYGIRPNGYGLIDDFDDARKVYEWIAEDEMAGTRAEPIPYDFWLLVSHPLEAENPA